MELRRLDADAVNRSGSKRVVGTETTINNTIIKIGGKIAITTQLITTTAATMNSSSRLLSSIGTIPPRSTATEITVTNQGLAIIGTVRLITAAAVAVIDKNDSADETEAALDLAAESTSNGHTNSASEAEEDVDVEEEDVVEAEEVTAKAPSM